MQIFRGNTRFKRGIEADERHGAEAGNGWGDEPRTDPGWYGKLRPQRQFSQTRCRVRDGLFCAPCQGDGSCSGHGVYCASNPEMSAPTPRPRKLALVGIAVARVLSSLPINFASQAVPVRAPKPMPSPLRMRPTYNAATLPPNKTRALMIAIVMAGKAGLPPPDPVGPAAEGQQRREIADNVGGIDQRQGNARESTCRS